MMIDLRMQRLVDDLNMAAKSYYSGSEESTLTDAQYDKMMEELIDLERIEGYRLATSPTLRVGYLDNTEKIKHQFAILSLKNTKSIEELLYFLGDREGILSWKLDGVSMVLYYLDGKLQRAVSRGDGAYGSDITNNAVLMQGVPQKIDQQGLVIIRGEGCISIKDFEAIKQSANGDIYRNPRNLVAGIVNAKAPRLNILNKMIFIAHTVVYLVGTQGQYHKKTELLEKLANLGFDVVPYKKIANYMLKNEINEMSNNVGSFDYPVDGLVLSFNSLKISHDVGETQRYPRDTMAFKWPDLTALTKVRGVKWSVSKTGLITPVVSFDPIELEGTTVKQANLHTLKGFEHLGLGKGDIIEVFKANKIIPEVLENLTRSATLDYPEKCPVCKGQTTVIATDKTRKLYCYTCRDKEINNHA